MCHTMMMHIIGAVHALVMNENCISSLFHIHWKPLKDIILKLSRYRISINRLTPLEYIGNCVSPSLPDMEQSHLFYWIQ